MVARRNFLVTGFGRSGTAFLSWAANHSPSWTVLHEPGGRDDTYLLQRQASGLAPAAPSAEMLERFKQNRYGEVNSFLRWVHFSIPVSRRAIIVRDPKEIALSVGNRRERVAHMVQIVTDLYHYYRELHVLAAALRNLPIISFARMTSEPEYLNAVFVHLGVDDVVATPALTGRIINANRTRRFAEYGALPMEVREVADHIVLDPRIIDASPIGAVR